LRDIIIPFYIRRAVALSVLDSTAGLSRVNSAAGPWLIPENVYNLEVQMLE